MSPPFRFALFAPSLDPRMGGIQSMAHHLFSGLGAADQGVAFSVGAPPPTPLPARSWHSRFHRFNTLATLSMVVAALRHHRRFRQHLNLVLAWRVGYAAWLLNRWHGVPYVVYVFGNEIYPERRGPVARWLIRRILGRAALVIAVSRFTAGLCRRHGIDHVAVVPPGLAFREGESADEVSSEVAGEATAAAEAGHSYTLLSLGRLEPRKGFDSSIAAVALLAGEFPALRYVIAGSGADASRLRRLAREHGVADRVELVGFVDEATKQRLYRQCDLFLMPSYEVSSRGSVEGFGIVYLEANMHGKMVVAGDSGGVRDAVRDGRTGYLVDGRDPAAIAAAIRRHLLAAPSDQQRADCIAWARFHAWPQTIRRTRALLRRRIPDLPR